MCHINPIISWGVCQWRFLSLTVCVCLRKCAVVTLHILLLCLHNCFLGAVWLSRAPLGEVLPADRQLGPAGDMPCPAEPLKSAGWLWTIAAGGGNQSVSIPCLSLFLSPSWNLSICFSLSLSPLQPPAQPTSTATESFMFTGRKATEKKQGRECNSSSKEVNMVSKDLKDEGRKTNKASACSYDHLLLDQSKCVYLFAVAQYWNSHNNPIHFGMISLTGERVLVFFLWKLLLRFMLDVAADSNPRGISISPMVKFIELRRPVRPRTFHNASHI